MISRRKFIKDISSASLLLWGGSMLNITSAEAEALSKKSTLRFIVASDGHYGQAGTEFDSFQESLLKHTSGFHSSSALDFCVINGDIIHDGKEHLVPSKTFLDKLPVKYYVTKGNHDRVSDEYWKEVWGMPVNHDVVINNNALLFATTSNEAGDYLSPDLAWMTSVLEKHDKRKNVFIFIHIPQAKWTKNGIETPAFFELIKKHKQYLAVFFFFFFFRGGGGGGGGGGHTFIHVFNRIAEACSHRTGILQHQRWRIHRHEGHHVAGNGELGRLPADLWPDTFAIGAAAKAASATGGVRSAMMPK